MTKFSNKHPILFSFIICAVTLVISTVTTWDDKPLMGWDKLLGDTLITIFCLVVIKKIGIWDTAGFRKKGFGKGLLLGIPFIIIGLAGAYIGNIGVDFNKLQLISVSNAILFTFNYLMVGVNEEITLRSLVLNNLLRNNEKTHKGVLRAVIISALIFGAIHIPNMFFMSPITVIVQAINAAAAGVLFAAIYIRSKNIWAGIVIHMLVDWLALFIEQCFTGGSSVLSIDMSIGQGLIMALSASTPPVVIALILLRKSVIEEAVQA